MNAVNLIGRLARDPVLRHIDSTDNDICSMTIAVDRPRAREGQPTADFIPITAFGPQAQNCAKYLAKGSQIAVSGSLRITSRKRDDGKYDTFVEVVAEPFGVQFLERARRENDTPVGTTQDPTQGVTVDVDNFAPFDLD